MGYVDDVQAMQDEVMNKTDDIFGQIQSIVSTASSSALNANIEATLGGEYSIVEPPYPEPDMTLEDAIAYIDALKDMLLNRPSYPSLTVSAPTQPTIDENIPTMPDVVMPDSPDITMPTFDATLPDVDVILPTVEYVFEEIPYASELSDSLYNLLKGDIEAGDYGLDPEDEERLFGRARDREMVAMQMAVNDAVRLHSAGGFTAPTGAAQRAVARAINEAAGKISSANRELAIEKARLYSDHKKHELSLAADYEKILRDYHTGVMERQLKSASDQITATISIATFQLERIKIFVQRYEALATVFETQAKVEMTKADIYKSQVDAVKAEVDANKTIIDAFIARNESIIKIFVSEVEAYKAQVDAWSKEIGGLADLYKADATALAAMADGYGKAFDSTSRYYTSEAEYLASLLNSRVNVQKFNLDTAVQKAQLELEGEKAEADVAASVASAALSALNVNASVGASATSDYGFRGSNQESTSTNTNYNYSFQGS